MTGENGTMFAEMIMNVMAHRILPKLRKHTLISSL